MERPKAKVKVSLAKVNNLGWISTLAVINKAKLGNKNLLCSTKFEPSPLKSINYALVQLQVRLSGGQDEVSDYDGSEKGFFLFTQGKD